MTISVASSAPAIRIKVKYIRPAGNKTGSLGVLPESENLVETYRSTHGIHTRWEYVRDPGTGIRLKAFRPIENDQLYHVEKERGVCDGDVCYLTEVAMPKGGRMTWTFVTVSSF